MGLVWDYASNRFNITHPSICSFVFLWPCTALLNGSDFHNKWFKCINIVLFEDVLAKLCGDKRGSGCPTHFANFMALHCAHYISV